MHDDLLLSFYGDDFTGSTDAMESLARHGLRTILFTDPPTPQQLQNYPGLRAFGIAGLTRSLPPDQMEQTLRPIFTALRSSAPIIHYKVCSTFDSSAAIGSIGRVIDVGLDVFGTSFVPVLAGAPSLGRFCLFGNLFARSGEESDLFRLDRHPSMSKHPITPMNEADLRIHLSRQTKQPIALLDVLQLDRPDSDLSRNLDQLVVGGARVVLIDVLNESHLAKIGSMLACRAESKPPLFIVGSSGVESALCAHWQSTGITNGLAQFQSPKHVGPILAVCGSCSPVTAAQIKWACAHGFAEVAINVEDIAQRPLEPEIARIFKSIQQGQSVCVHTRAGAAKPKDSPHQPAIGAALGKLLRTVLESVQVRRVLVAGGDTSSHIARALGIQAVEMIAELTRGSPLCRATAPGSPADGLEITFKGGQIGKQDFFTSVEHPSKG